MKNSNSNWFEIVGMLNEKKLTISAMESCTGGAIANEITNISGASEVLHESYVTYCNSAKVKHGVSAEVISKYTVYSAEVALEMAKAVMKLSNSDIGIGVTGLLGRIDPNNPVDKLNVVWYSVVTKDSKIVRKIKVPNADRSYQKKFVCYEVALTLAKVIREINPNR